MNILKEVIAVANSDGKITDDEYNILTQMSIDVAEYSIMLERFKSDGIIDADEKTKLQMLKKRILENAQIVAELDDEVTEEELNLLKKLQEVVQK